MSCVTSIQKASSNAECSMKTEEAFTDLSFENKDLIDFNRAKKRNRFIDHEKKTQ
jgi:hypothetical protein